jgi:hypothetical protein
MKEFDVYQEAYYGKAGLIPNIEKQIGIIIDKIKIDPHYDVTNSTENKILQNLITKQFGFKETYCMWYKDSELSPQIATYSSIDSVVSGKCMFEIDSKKGYYDKTHSTVALINLSTALVRSIDITPREYTALILHEIGHNFDFSFYKGVSWLIKFIRIVNELRKRNFIDPISTLFHNVNSLKFIPGRINMICEKIIGFIFEKIPIIKSIYGFLLKSGDWIGLQIRKLSTYINIPFTPLEVLLSPVSQLFTLPGKKSEEFADSFAIAYGYGPELISALYKSDQSMQFKRTKKVSSFPIIRVLTDIRLAEASILDEFTSPMHGSSSNRTTIAIELLKRELAKTGVNPKVKKEIQESINDLQTIYQNYLDGNVNGEYLVITAATRTAIDTMFQGRTDIITTLFPNFYAGDRTLELESGDDSDIDTVLMIMESFNDGLITEQDRDELIMMI